MACPTTFQQNPAPSATRCEGVAAPDEVASLQPGFEMPVALLPSAGPVGEQAGALAFQLRNARHFGFVDGDHAAAV